MKRWALVLAAASCLGACTEPGVPQTGLTGRWIEDGVPKESARDFLIGQAKVFVYTVPFPDGAVTFISGDWTTDGNHIRFTTKSKTEYPASGGSKKTEPYVDERFFKDATFTLTPSVLTLTYVTYPFDAPVATVMTLRRE